MIWTVKDWLWWYYLHACCLFYISLFRLCVSQFFVFLLNFVVHYRSVCTLQSRSLVFIKPRETIALVYFYVWYMHFLVCHYLHIVHHVRYDCLREIYNRLDTTTGLKGKLTSWWIVPGGWWLLLGETHQKPPCACLFTSKLLDYCSPLWFAWRLQLVSKQS